MPVSTRHSQFQVLDGSTPSRPGRRGKDRKSPKALRHIEGYQPADTREPKRRKTAATLNGDSVGAIEAPGDNAEPDEQHNGGGTDDPDEAITKDAILQLEAAARQEAEPDSAEGAETTNISGLLGPEQGRVVNDIIGHSERIENHFDISSADPFRGTGPKGLVFVKTGSRMKIESLPILDNLSTQLLSILAKASYPEIVAMVLNPDSGTGQDYSTVRSLFDHTKRVYSTKTPFLSATELDIHDSSQVEILRKANLATFVSSLFGTHEIGFHELNANFLEVFVPEHGRLLKVQAAIYLGLKTQAFIASMNSEERSKTESLYSLFSEDLEEQILSRRPGARGLAPGEQDFVKRAYSRREILLADVNNEAALGELPDRYKWEDFLKEVSHYLSKNVDSIIAQPNRKSAKGRLSTTANGSTPEIPQNQLENNFSIKPAQHQPPAAGGDSHEDFITKAARAAQMALQGNFELEIPPPPPLITQHVPTARYNHVQPEPIFQQYIPPTQHHSESSRGAESSAYGPLPDLPHVSQSAPTQVLYERARQAASAKASPARRAGLPSQRRPWTTEEENALMAGLDRVRGPHWSQILAMFGPGGTINESLKDRNQVQLKDKARNLKLFFLKSGIEVPYYLKYVTGDLRTRAPAQASKHEARERERQQGEEDKAHFDGVQGIMALAGANQQFPDMEGMPMSEEEQQRFLIDHGLLDPNLGGVDNVIPDSGEGTGGDK